MELSPTGDTRPWPWLECSNQGAATPPAPWPGLLAASGDLLSGQGPGAGHGLQAARGHRLQALLQVCQPRGVWGLSGQAGPHPPPRLRHLACLYPLRQAGRGWQHLV